MKTSLTKRTSSKAFNRKEARADRPETATEQPATNVAAEKRDTVSLGRELRESARETKPPSPDQPAHHGTVENETPSGIGQIGKPTGPTKPTPTEAAIEAADQEGDLSLLNEVDKFRESLPPELQQEYDDALADLREDDRINFVYQDAEQSDATEDLILRHILGSNFGRMDEIDRLLELASGGDRGDGEDNGLDDGLFGTGLFASNDGALDIVVDGNNDVDPDPERSAGGYSFRDGDIEISLPLLLSQNESGRGSVVAHEFAHARQLGGDPDRNPESNFSDFSILPPDVRGEQFDEFNDLYRDAYPPEEGDYDDSVHYFTRVTEEFFTDPQGLAERSPELYEWFADYQNFDPVAGRREEPQEQDPFDRFLENITDVFSSWTTV